LFLNLLILKLLKTGVSV